MIGIKKLIVIFCGGIIVLFTVGCKKTAGSGGSSSIKGKVSGVKASGNPKQEVTYITCVEGAIIDDNDYILLNSPGGTNYYIWFDNTNWTGGDPGLTGRTGIKVIYDFTQSNTTVATNVLSAIEMIAGNDFSVSVSNDILTVTCKEFGSVPDAEDVNSPLLIDIEQQGSGGTVGSQEYVPVVDERVFLIYGDEEFYSEDVRTDANGNFQFKNLLKGKYTIYVFSEENSSTSSIISQTASVEITKNKEVVNAGEIQIVY